MEILKGLFAKDKALWLPAQKVLVIADLHIGYEEALNKQGIFMPRRQFSEMQKELKEQLMEFKPRVVVINGDLKHEFGEISKQEWWETSKILDLILSCCKKVILVKGNHDTILKPIARKKGLEVRDFYKVNDICFLHGDVLLKNKQAEKAKMLVIGHEHPAVSLREGRKIEKYKCYLLGRWKRQKLLVMPSFFSIFEGVDVKKEKLLSPYLQQNLSKFELFIVGDKVYKFGKLENI